MARNVLAENASVQKAQQTSIYFSGWMSLILGLVGGAYLMASWLGAVLRWPFGLLPDDVITVVFVLWFIGVVYDIGNDLTPNYTTVTFAVVGPTLAGAAKGDLAANLLQWAQVLSDGVGGKLAPWVGGLSSTGLAIVFCGAALMIAKRTLQKQATMAGRGAGGGR